MLISVNVFWKIQVLVTVRVLHFFFLLPCLDEAFVTGSQALGIRAAEESSGTVAYCGSCGCELPCPRLALCHLSLRASWLLKGQNLLSLFYRWRNWSWPWVGGMPQVMDLVRAQPGKEPRLLIILPLKHAG